MKIRGNIVGTNQKPEKVVVKATGLTEEQKAQARANIGAIGEGEVDTSGLVAKEELFDITTTSSKNMLNPNDPDYVVDKHMSANGTRYTTATGWDTTGYMAVEPGDRVSVWVNLHNTEKALMSINTTTNVRIYGYDENKTVVSSAYAYNTGLKYYTVPDGVYYLRMSFARGSFNPWMIYKLTGEEDGTTAYRPIYEPYEEGSESISIKPELYKVPTKTSELENDSGFVTQEELNGIATKKVKPLALPTTMYAFVNQPIVTYLRNILPYDPNDVYVRLATNSKGKLYKDRWEYTPSGAETVPVRYIVCDRDYNELNDDTFSLVVKNTTTKGSLKVLVLGDSTVNEGKETQKMLDLATADGYDLTLLGTRGATGSVNQHEGRGGWTAEMYCNNASNTDGRVVNAFYNPTSATFDFSYYMAQQGYSGVDCVFIQLGINDLFPHKTDSALATAISTYLSNMEAIINSIHAYDANIKIVLNMIIPCCDDQDAFTGTYGMTQTTWRCRKNTYDGNIALMNKFGGKTNIYISQYHASLDTANNMDGGVHPVQTGYEQLGTQMYSFMRAIN